MARLRRGPEPLRRRRRLAPGSPRGRASRPGARAPPDRRPRSEAAARRRSPFAPYGWQADAERATAPFVAVELDPSLVFAHDLARDEEPESGAVSGLLRRKERIEDVPAIGQRDPATRVGDGDLHLILARPGTSRHLDSPVGWRGVDRVGEEVQDHLLKLIALAQDRRQPGLGAHGEGEPGTGESRAD